MRLVRWPLTLFLLLAGSLGVSSDLLPVMKQIWSVLGGSSQFWTGTNFCNPADFIGVQCSSQGWPISLKLSKQGLTGPIPQAIGQLTNLTILFLDNNYLGGSTIPDSIGNLTHLESLDLSSSGLSGSLPSSLGRLQKLQNINLLNSGQTGSIEPLLRISSLVRIELGGCHLSGPIPDLLGNWSNVTYLSVWRNNLNGTIPPSLAKMKNVNFLDFGGNHFTGSIPDVFEGFSNLGYLSFWNNQMNGTFPLSLRDSHQLFYLDLAVNQFEGEIPSFVSTFTLLARLSLSNNKFSGAPPNATALTRLGIFAIDRNQFEGSLDLSNLRLLTFVDVSYNGLTQVAIKGLFVNGSCYLNNNLLPCYPLYATKCEVTYLPCTVKDKINMLYDGTTKISTAEAQTLLNATVQVPSEIIRALTAVSAALLRNTSFFSFNQSGISLQLETRDTSDGSNVFSQINNSSISASFPSSILNSSRVSVSLSSVSFNPFLSLHNETIYSSVVGVEVYDTRGNTIEISDSRENVNITMGINITVPDGYDAICQYWNESNGIWSREGCTLFIQEQLSICQCNHLTNFSIGAILPLRPERSNSSETTAPIAPDSPTKLIIIVVVCGIGGLLMVAIIAFTTLRLVRGRKSGGVDIGTQADEEGGKIEWIERVSKGSKTEVWKAIHNGVTTVAVKKRDEKNMYQLAQEATRLKSLHHPNVVMYLGQNLSEKWLMIEWMEDGSLYHYVKSNPLTSYILFNIAFDVAKAMSYLSEQCIVHTQLTPLNVLLRIVHGTAVAKITNFGESVEEGARYHRKPEDHTAPEVAQYGTQYSKSDVWSYGILLWFMASGGREFHQNFKKRSSPVTEDGWETTIKSLIQECTQMEASNRPIFSDLAKRLKRGELEAKQEKARFEDYDPYSDR